MAIEWYSRAVRNLGLVPLLRLQIGKKLSAGPIGRASSKRLKHPVWYRRNASDLMVFDQIFIEREYSCIDHLADLRLIIDCGANVGYSSAYFLSRFPNAFVIAVEPDPGNFAMLSRNLAPYAGRYIALQKAVWSEETVLSFDVETLAEGQDWGRKVSVDKTPGNAVQAIDIDSLIAMKDYDRISLLKIDIEGAEEEIFARNYENWLGRTDNFVIEVHGPERAAIVDKAIAGRGFALSTCGELTVGIGSARTA